MAISSEENFYYGYLEFSEENEITLEIIEIHIFHHMPGSKCELVILGKLENGKKVTLELPGT